ncbi:MAG: tetratricopeptide repeat protein [Candidatus Rokubacteria bacterium]|nr:tetratricopeptide repeat protein [Candidatus Rokubacteria bacterium]
MLYDSYRRYGASFWPFLIFFFQPLGAVIYFVANARTILHGLSPGSGGGPGLFGLGLKAKIRKTEQQMLVSETEALRAELAELYYQDKRYEDAERLFQKVLENDPESQEALYYLALCKLERQDFKSGCAYLQKLVDKNRKYRFGTAWLRYAETLDKLGRREEALAELRPLSRAFPRPLTEFAYAKMLAEAGQKDKARETLEYMLSTSSEAPAEDRTWLRQGQTLLRSLS